MGNAGEHETPTLALNGVPSPGRRAPIIALFSRVEETSLGGIETVVRELAPRLTALRPDWNVRPIHAFSQSSRLNKLPFVVDLVAGARLWWLARTADAVVINGAEYAWLAALDPRFKAKTLVVWHGTRAYEIPALRAKMSFAVRVYLRLECWLQYLAFRFPRQIVVAPSVLEELRTTYRRTGDAIVVTNGAPVVDVRLNDSTAASNGTPKFSVVWSGSNAYKKGLDLALAACRLARATIGDLELHVFGLPNVDAISDPWIRWHGRQPQQHALEAVATADVFLATTRYEACSMAVLEAMALGTAIVGSPTIAWMLDDVGGAVADYVPQSFADGMVSARASGERRVARIARARSTLARFDWSDTARAYVRSIQDALSAASNAGRNV